MVPLCGNKQHIAYMIEKETAETTVLNTKDQLKWEITSGK